MNMAERLRIEMALQWFTCGIFKDKTKSPNGHGFRLKLHEKNPDAPFSPVYMDFRLLQSFPQVLKKTAEAVEIEIEKGMGYDRLAPIPVAAIPLVTVISQDLNIPMVMPREGKTHGSGAKVDGEYGPDMSVLVFDDLVTKADSKIEAVQTLRSAGLHAKHVVVLLDREQGGMQQLFANDIQLTAMFTFSELLKLYLDYRRISQQLYDEITTYLAQS